MVVGVVTERRPRELPPLAEVRGDVKRRADAEKRRLAAGQRPHLHYVEDRYRGYFVIDMTKQRLQADFYGVETILERSNKERFEKGFITESGSNHLVEASKPAV
mgnify:CR=1 FL=1